MLASMDSKEISEWAAYYSIEPFGYFRSADLPAAIVASTLANCNRTKHSKTFTPKDFILVGEHAHDKAMEEDEMQSILQAMTGQAPTEANE
tara:strand:- start:58 stop:330 length:273 start_codon:yes stop_codon:yes gene_type:complete